MKFRCIAAGGLFFVKFQLGLACFIAVNSLAAGCDATAVNTEAGVTQDNEGGAGGEQSIGGTGGSAAGGHAGSEPTEVPNGSGGSGGANLIPTREDAGTAAEFDAAITKPNLRPAILGAGYGGIRALSFDEGATWKTVGIQNPANADDSFLIRAANYVQGVWIAVGWKVYRSVDGIQWDVTDLPGGWYDCVTESAGKIIVKTIRADYGGQNGDTLSSGDQGKTWQEVKTSKPVCNANPKPFTVGNAWLRPASSIERSTDQGKTWRTVLKECCWVETFAKGMAQP